ncbi:Crp/Fnr family transcriptional regulator [Mesosutterella sp. OilRF-GAM-744-9]|uniref:Crp/Fnr family transcriptional regulator n=1 Tax=Mesosutterella porci TaxID=2915351 RepID=A0ABS9MU29_9BURK|nr:Crp/Fnr family transcriptional regulator [Mesosutterella sp. oilRF-744-WT-GAM-9]MCG5031523.1 Crp/Fnr family transcriptional regulator [Mesosutterella sp. oilRF-744-WT-GAM-9]
MRQVFLSRPWIHQKEPEPLARIFETYGVQRKLPKGHLFSHGGEQGGVSYLVKGMAFFSFPDNEDRDRIFALLPPHRVIGDLDALTEFHLNIVAITARPSEVLTVSGDLYRREILKDPSLLYLYTRSAIAKEEAHMEGLFANFTFPLEQRVIALFSALIGTYYPLKPRGWNPLPLNLTTFEIADIVASNRSTISTIVNGWVEKGLARRDGRRLVLHGTLFANEYDWTREVDGPRRARLMEK